MKTRLDCIAIVTAVVLFCLPATIPRRALAGAVVQGPIMPATQIGTLKITLLSTMLVEARRVSESGVFPRWLKPMVIVFCWTPSSSRHCIAECSRSECGSFGRAGSGSHHNHWDHVPAAHVATRDDEKESGRHVSRVCRQGNLLQSASADGEDNRMIAIRKEYEAREENLSSIPTAVTSSRARG